MTGGHDLDGLRRQLADACEGRNLSDAAKARLDKLLAVGTADEIEEVIAHLRWLPRPDQRGGTP